MTRTDGQPTLEDVLDTYISAVEEPDLKSAREWGRRFPEYGEAIRDFAVSWRLAASLPADPSVQLFTGASFAEQGSSIVADVFRRAREAELATTGGPSIDSLLGAAKARGIAPAELAIKLDVSIPLVGKLNRRLIEYSSIPHELIEAFALNLAHEPDAVSRYLAQPSMLAAGGFHRAAGKPTLTAQEDFAAAVRADPALTATQRARWLSLASRGKREP